MRTNLQQWVHSNKCNLLNSKNLSFIYWKKGNRFKRRVGAKPLAGGYYFESTRKLRAYERHLISINDFYQMQALQSIEEAKRNNKKKAKQSNAKAKNSKN